MQKLKSKWYDKYIAPWQHLDFTWGLDAASVVYDDIIKRINEIEYGL